MVAQQRQLSIAGADKSDDVGDGDESGRIMRTYNSHANDMKYCHYNAECSVLYYNMSGEIRGVAV